MNILIKIVTMWRLGLLNLVRVLTYRVALKSGWIGFKLKCEEPIQGPFFSVELPKITIRKNILETLTVINRPEIKPFGWLDMTLETPPSWHRSILSNLEHNQTRDHWTKIKELSGGTGDIKGIWEFSRFEWLLKFIRLAVQSSEEKWILKANHWLENWSKENPLNIGPNWTCGQESSIRVMHMALACYLLKQHLKPTQALQELIQQHLSRISPTILYAIAQDNNHGTSEAAALFIGGTLLNTANESKKATYWQKKGRLVLENRVSKLISTDGSFSMYSLNYHRVLLDTLSLAEVWRREFNLLPFSDLFYERARHATLWLREMVDITKGDAPNIGNNDGARLISLTDSDLRDFRPSVQLATAVFLKKRAFAPKGDYDEPVHLLGVVSSDENMSPLDSCLYPEGGYVILRNKSASAFMRYPKYKFRPGHSDALHLDLFVNGKYILRDGGTYSYNCKPSLSQYFSGVVSHNTVQFDDHDQMPKISPFLYGSWLRGKADRMVTKIRGRKSFSASYKDRWGSSHKREIVLHQNKIVIIDRIDGIKQLAVLRWRLLPEKWVLKGNYVRNDSVSIKISSSREIQEIKIVDGWESRYYSKKDKLPVLEIVTRQNNVLTTEIKWS